jgi:hypothetical protein
MIQLPGAVAAVGTSQAEGLVALGGVLARGGRGGAGHLGRSVSCSAQILAYKEDFSSERADRERAQSRIQELEDKVAALLFQVSHRQVRQGRFSLAER